MNDYGFSVIRGLAGDSAIPWRKGMGTELSEGQFVEAIRWANNLYGLIAMIDYWHSKGVQEGRIKSDAGFVRDIRLAYEWWYSPYEEFQANNVRLDSFDPVEGLSALDANLIRVRRMLSVPVESLIWEGK